MYFGIIFQKVKFNVDPYTCSSVCVAVVYVVNEGSTLITPNDRVGWLIPSLQYVEFLADGSELGRYNCLSGLGSI